MRPRRPPPPPEMPARLRCFDPGDWGATTAASDDELREARWRQTDALLEWCSQHQISPLDVLLERRRNRATATDDMTPR